MNYFINTLSCLFLSKCVVINNIIYLLVNMHNAKSCYCFFVHLYKLFYLFLEDILMFKIISNGKKKLTIKAVGDLWLQSKKLNVKSSSYYNYKRILEKHIYTALGELKYSAITQSQLNSFIENLLSSGRKDGKGGLSDSTVKDIITLMKSISKFAHSEFNLKDICKNLKLSQLKKTKFKSYQTAKEKNLNHICLTTLIFPIYVYC